MISTKLLLRSFALSAGLLAAGCESSTYDSPPPTTQGPDYFYENEPNDTPAFPDFIQYVDPFTDSIIEGRLEGGPAPFYDTYDHFEFVAATEGEFVFELFTAAPYADLAVGVFDPYLGEMVLWWDSVGDVEFGSFVVHQPGTVFQIVVHAPDFGADYSMDLYGYPYPYAATAGGPGEGTPEQALPRISAGTQDRAQDSEPVTRDELRSAGA